MAQQETSYKRIGDKVASALTVVLAGGARTLTGLIVSTSHSTQLASAQEEYRESLAQTDGVPEALLTKINTEQLHTLIADEKLAQLNPFDIASSSFSENVGNILQFAGLANLAMAESKRASENNEKINAPILALKSVATIAFPVALAKFGETLDQALATGDLLKWAECIFHGTTLAIALVSNAEAALINLRRPKPVMQDQPTKPNKKLVSTKLARLSHNHTKKDAIPPDPKYGPNGNFERQETRTAPVYTPPQPETNHDLDPMTHKIVYDEAKRREMQGDNFELVRDTYVAVIRTFNAWFKDDTDQSPKG